MTNWKQLLTELKHQYLEKTAPQFYAASGGRTMILKRYCDTNTNALTGAVMDWLKFHNCYANRINTMGTYRNGKYTPSSTRRGTGDINCIIKPQNSLHGIPVSLEIKCKATNDKMSEDQLKEKARIEAAGGIYYVVTDMQSFIDWYKATFENAHLKTTL